MGSTSSNFTQSRADSQYNFYRNNQEESSIIMPNVKLTYFNLRARGEPCRLLLAYGGIKYEDNRIAPPWDPTSTWSSLKPTTPFGQLPVLNWDEVEICQSMAAARFIAREVGLAGNSSLEQAQVDEVIDVIQDLINVWVKLYFAKDEAGLKNFADVTLQTALGQLEKKLTARGGQYFVGNNLTWADLHVYMYATDAVDKAVLAKFPSSPTLLRESVMCPTSRPGLSPDQKLTCKRYY